MLDPACAVCCEMLTVLLSGSSIVLWGSLCGRLAVPGSAGEGAVGTRSLILILSLPPPLFSKSLFRNIVSDIFGAGLQLSSFPSPTADIYGKLVHAVQSYTFTMSTELKKKYVIFTV